MALIEIRIPTLHLGQAEIWKNRGKRNAVRTGRRFGKTKLLIALAADGAAKGKKVGVFTPEHRQTIEPFEEIAYCLDAAIAARSKNEGAIKTVTGGKIDFWHLNDNELAGRGREYDLILMDEVAFTKNGQMTDIWQKSIVPTMATKPNAEVWAFSTPNGIDPDNFFWKICHEEDFSFKQHHAPSWGNPLVSKEWIEEERKRLPPEVFLQELECEFVDWSGVAFFSLDKWLENDAPVPLPDKCDVVFAVIDTATKTGTDNDGTAVTYFAKINYLNRLVILDWDTVQIEGALLDTWLTGVFQNLEYYARLCGARGGSSGAWIEDKASGMILLQQARKRGLNVHPIGGAWMAQGKDERALSVSSYHYQGQCKISGPAYDKTVVYKGTSRNHLVAQTTGFRIGDKDAAKRADDLLDSYVHGLALGLGDGKQF